MTKPFSILARVDYVDTDAMAVMHHSAYFRYLERCRVEWLRLCGLDYKSLENEGWALPLRSTHLTYFRPLRFDDEFSVEMTAKLSKGTRFVIHYKVFSYEKLCAEGQTEHVCCKLEGGQLVPTKIPTEWKELPQWQQLVELKS